MDSTGTVMYVLGHVHIRKLPALYTFYSFPQAEILVVEYVIKPARTIPMKAKAEKQNEGNWDPR